MRDRSSSLCVTGLVKVGCRVRFVSPITKRTRQTRFSAVAKTCVTTAESPKFFQQRIDTDDNFQAVLRAVLRAVLSDSLMLGT